MSSVVFLLVLKITTWARLTNALNGCWKKRRTLLYMLLISIEKLLGLQKDQQIRNRLRLSYFHVGCAENYSEQEVVGCKHWFMHKTYYSSCKSN
jgi:hypothetical protein